MLMLERERLDRNSGCVELEGAYCRKILFVPHHTGPLQGAVR